MNLGIGSYKVARLRTIVGSWATSRLQGDGIRKEECKVEQNAAAQMTQHSSVDRCRVPHTTTHSTYISAVPGQIEWASVGGRLQIQGVDNLFL